MHNAADSNWYWFTVATVVLDGSRPEKDAVVRLYVYGPLPSSKGHLVDAGEAIYLSTLCRFNVSHIYSEGTSLMLVFMEKT